MVSYVERLSGHEMSLGGVNYDTCRAAEAGYLG